MPPLVQTEQPPVATKPRTLLASATSLSPTRASVTASAGSDRVAARCMCAAARVTPRCRCRRSSMAPPLLSSGSASSGRTCWRALAAARRCRGGACGLFGLLTRACAALMLLLSHRRHPAAFRCLSCACSALCLLPLGCINPVLQLQHELRQRSDARLNAGLTLAVVAATPTAPTTALLAAPAAADAVAASAPAAAPAVAAAASPPAIAGGAASALFDPAPVGQVRDAIGFDDFWCWCQSCRHGGCVLRRQCSPCMPAGAAATFAPAVPCTDCLQACLPPRGVVHLQDSLSRRGVHVPLRQDGRLRVVHRQDQSRATGIGQLGAVGHALQWRPRGARVVVAAARQRGGGCGCGRRAG